MPTADGNSGGLDGGRDRLPFKYPNGELRELEVLSLPASQGRLASGLVRGKRIGVLVEVPQDRKRLVVDLAPFGGATELLKGERSRMVVLVSQSLL